MHIVEKYFAVIQIIEAAESIYDFRKLPSLRFKVLRGNQNLVSFRLNDSYRLIAEMRWRDEQKTVAELVLIEINNHYE
jgi:plasmid maintenance system killer protein